MLLGIVIGFLAGIILEYAVALLVVTRTLKVSLKEFEDEISILEYAGNNRECDLIVQPKNENETGVYITLKE